MQIPGSLFFAWLVLAVAGAAVALADTDTVSKAGATTVLVTIPVHGAPSSLRAAKTIPELLSRVAGLSADEKQRILDAVKSGFVTAVRLESDSDGHSSWVELPAVGATVFRGDSTFKFQPPEIEVTTSPRQPAESTRKK